MPRPSRKSDFTIDHIPMRKKPPIPYGKKQEGRYGIAGDNAVKNMINDIYDDFFDETMQFTNPVVRDLTTKQSNFLRYYGRI